MNFDYAQQFKNTQMHMEQKTTDVANLENKIKTRVQFEGLSLEIKMRNRLIHLASKFIKTV